MKWPKRLPSVVSKSSTSSGPSRSSRRSAFRTSGTSSVESSGSRSRSSSRSDDDDDSSSVVSPSISRSRSGSPEKDDDNNKVHPHEGNNNNRRSDDAGMEFSLTGKVLTQEEKIQRAKLKGYCIKCGITTHKGKNSIISKRPITNIEVWQGICIKCHPTKVPNPVRFKYFNSVVNSDKSVLTQSSKSTTTSNNSDTTIQSLQQQQQNGGSTTTRTTASYNNKFKKAATKISAATAFMQARRKVYVPKSAHQKVLESMKFIQDDLKGTGMDFFVGVFLKYPQVKQLFPFGMDIRDGISIEEIRDCKKLQMHSYLVMKTLANIVGGLSDFQSLIPYLRELGRRHIVYGIIPEYYDLIFETLMETIARRVNMASALDGNTSSRTLAVQGPCWTNETKQAWEVCYNAIKSVMANPSKHLEFEKPNLGWGLYHTIACCYICVLTPYRLAIMDSTKTTTTSFSTKILSFLAISIIIIDIVCQKLQQIVFYSQNEESKSKSEERAATTPSSPDLSLSSSAPPNRDNKNSGKNPELDSNIVSNYIDQSRIWIMGIINEVQTMLQNMIVLINNDDNNKWLFGLKLRIKRLFRRIQVNRWEYWVHIDAMILTSFVLEYMFLRNHWIGYYFPQTIHTILICCIVAIQCSGLTRVVHFWYRLEMMALQNTTASSSSTTTATNFFFVVRYQHLLLIRLILLFMYTIHLLGCAYLMVYHAPDKEEANDQTVIYFHSLYWAFVNVTGIGQYHGDAPTTPLEIAFSLLTHCVGLVFYFVMAGQCLAFTKDHAHSANEIEDGMRSLTSFMEECDIPKLTQEKCLSSYIMQHFVTNKSSSSSKGERDNVMSTATTTNNNNGNSLEIQQRSIPDVVSKLPSHLSMELTLFARAKELRRRGLPKASEDFALGLVSMLSQNVSLLAGDYLIKAGQKIKRPGKVWMIDHGVLEVFVDGISKGCLYPGDILGKGWLSTQPMEARETVEYKSYMDWRSIQGDVAIADIRCMAHCRLLMGIGDMSEISYLRRSYPTEMQRLTEECTPVTLKQPNTSKRISVPTAPAPIIVPIEVPLNDVASNSPGNALPPTTLI